MKKDAGRLKPGRNDLCHCGSGKKYKNCCWEKDQDARSAATMDRMGAELQHRLNPIVNPEDDVPLRTRNGVLPQMNRGELFWAGLQEGGGKVIPDLPEPLGNDPFEKTGGLPPEKVKAKAKRKKK
jgi:hypothetical protein